MTEDFELEQPPASGTDAVKQALPNLVSLGVRVADAREAYNEAVKGVALKSGLRQDSIKAYVSAKIAEDPSRKIFETETKAEEIVTLINAIDGKEYK